MEPITNLLSSINSIVWGIPMLVLLAIGGIFLTIGLSFVPIRKIPYSFKLLFKGNVTSPNDKGDITPFNSLMTALSATVGTGNIAGVATAIALGGPGAVFYMWLIALIGLATKYSEAVAAVSFREIDTHGNYVGGPMYYIKNGLKDKFPIIASILAYSFAIFTAVAAFGIGNGVQVNSMALALGDTFGIHSGFTGVIVAVLIGAVLLGGIKRIADVAGKLVPTMIILYLGSGLIILAINIAKIPEAISLIFYHAFNPAAAAGGFAGAAVAAAIRFGVARGVFSNESGLGSAAIAHAAAKTNDPARQGHIAMLGTFIDTIIVCSITALVILTTSSVESGENGAVLTTLAFSNVLPFGAEIVTIALAVFAFTTIMGWSYYGEKSIQYLFGDKIIIPYRILWVLAIPFGALVELDFIWLLSDTLNAMMALPNIIGLILLSPFIFKKTKEYWENKKLGK